MQRMIGPAASTSVRGHLQPVPCSTGRLPGARCRRALSVKAEVWHVGDAWVVSRSTRTRRIKPKGVVHFLGGAFAGAAPQVLYASFLDKLAARGYTVVATPYAVTFRHLDCAASVRSRFESTVRTMQQDGMEWLVPESVPRLAVGHSMGALMHALIASVNPGDCRGAALISFNNKQVSDCIPIPGLMDNLPGAMQAARAAPPPPVPLPDAAGVLRGALSVLPPQVAGVLDEGGRLSRAALALEQLASVVGEVEGGTKEFTPTPAETRALLSNSYSLPRTLLLRFEVDTTDETKELEAILQTRLSRGSGALRSLLLPGNHTTPCGGGVPWKAGPVFSPLDAAVQLAQYAAQSDLRKLADVVCDWLDETAANCSAPTAVQPQQQQGRQQQEQQGSEQRYRKEGTGVVTARAATARGQQSA